MRTTITIDDRLLEAAKRRAAEQGSSVSRLVAEALRLVLARPERAGRTKPFRLITYRGRGPRPGIDLDRTGALHELDDVAAYRRTPR